jgi:photosystem II stability/assembly factor-like uncharacterized protein
MSMKRAVALAAVLAGVLVAVASAASVQVPLSGWSWGNPTPQGNALSAIDFQAGRGYAVGAAGTALRTDDGGTTWSGLATGTSADLTRLQIVDPDIVVVLGGGGCVLRRSDDGGKTFRKIFIVAESGCPDRVQSAFFVDKNIGYLLLRDGSVLRTADGGQSFSKQTAVPGTPASATGGNAAAADFVFTGPDSGIAFINPPGGAPSQAFATTDDGVSWKPLAIDAGVVDRVYRFDANTIYGVGPSTLLRSTDGGKTFVKRPFGDGLHLTSIGCADPDTCLITTDRGELDRTTDGGATATTITASSVPLAGAAFASATRAVGVGAAGQTVISDDAGVNYTAMGGDLGGQFSRLRLGPTATSALAPGSKGEIALTFDGGANWRTAAVPTSAPIADASFSSATVGYAADARGGLFRTQNAGLSWQTLSAGPGAPAPAVLALHDGQTVLLIGPRGVRRAVGGGQFDTVAGKLVAKAQLSDVQRAGSAILAWTRGGRQLLASVDKGRTWKAVTLPSKRTRVLGVSFLSRGTGYVLDATGRVWATRNGGRSWRESIATGTSRAQSISFGSASSGYLNIGSFGTDSADAYALHTGDGGRTWRPQAISTGRLAPSGLVAGDATHAFTLLGTHAFFFTASAGDAGSPSSLKIAAKPARFTKRSLKQAAGRVTIGGTLAGAVGGEQITISARGAGGGSWSTQTVTAGANGGSFSATFRIRGSSVFVAQWPGDSGRTGVGSPALLVNVR